MGAVTGVLTKSTEMSGQYKIVCITGAVASASDTITLTEADHGITAITAVLGSSLFLPLGTGAGTTCIGVSHDGLVLTVTALEGDGTAAAVFGSQYSIAVLGTV